MARGERILAGLIGAAGLFWFVQSLRLRYWSDFGPGTGFLPLWLSAILVVLVAVLLVQSYLRARPVAAAAAAEPTRHGRVAAIALGLFACVAVLDWVGFVVAIGGYLLFLLAVVERRGARETALVTIGTTAGLFLLFHAWLRVPLPTGPWGF